MYFLKFGMTLLARESLETRLSPGVSFRFIAKYQFRTRSCAKFLKADEWNRTKSSKEELLE